MIKFYAFTKNNGRYYEIISAGTNIILLYEISDSGVRNNPVAKINRSIAECYEIYSSDEDIIVSSDLDVLLTIRELSC